MPRIGFTDRLRYAFDNSMSRGAVALIGYLGLASVGLIAFFALVVVLFNIAPAGRRSAELHGSGLAEPDAHARRRHHGRRRGLGRSASPCWA